MSKPVVRVLFSVLISLAVVVAIYTSVQAGANTAKGRLISGALVNLNHYRLSPAEQENYEAQSDAQSGEGCHHDSMISPDD